MKLRERERRKESCAFRYLEEEEEAKEGGERDGKDV